MENFKAILYDLKNRDQEVVFLEKSVFTTIVTDEPLEMGKDMKIKQCLLPPTKYVETFFIKKFCMGEQTFLGKFLGGCFSCELMIKSGKGGS